MLIFQSVYFMDSSTCKPAPGIFIEWVDPRFFGWWFYFCFLNAPRQTFKIDIVSSSSPGWKTRQVKKSFRKQKMDQVIQSDIILSPSWRSLNLWRGHLTIPKRSPAELPGNCRIFHPSKCNWWGWNNPGATANGDWDHKGLWWCAEMETITTWIR